MKHGNFFALAAGFGCLGVVLQLAFWVGVIAAGVWAVKQFL